MSKKKSSVKEKIKKTEKDKEMEDFDSRNWDSVSVPAYLMISDKQARTPSEEMSGLLEHDFKKEHEEKNKKSK